MNMPYLTTLKFILQQLKSSIIKEIMALLQIKQVLTPLSKTESLMQMLKR